MSDTAPAPLPGAAAHPFAGHHLLAELYGVVPSKLDDPELLAGALRRGVEQGGATLLHLEVRRFNPHGVTVLALLAESHASLHSYPEAGALFFDAFTCGKGQPEAILAAVVAALAPGEVRSSLIQRGLGRFSR
ncbi:MAG: S-adenosylmethionine decarboxylase proenzyme, prokaryotic class 1B [uncultured Truepera sp.]|uniref:S-adenosylmethionine decarboxylase proenzyme, prokaryotic class 1B n=1 Tax=uncultured Truepera sp. TaxID=543023 RepID=A0A6J4VBG1_9DEIN|nr:MAG: S-adenosylmethionine decarboxylase proenzyme, prokaryotic class 1B [uncultured Truepera sp.]